MRAEHEEIVLLDAHLDRRAALLPIGQQLIQPRRVKHRTGQDMRPHFRALFEDHDLKIGVDLLEPDRRGQPSRPRPHDHHIVIHRLAFDLGHIPNPLACRYRLGFCLA